MRIIIATGHGKIALLPIEPDARGQMFDLMGGDTPIHAAIASAVRT
jgi:hypothetical protein